MGEFLNLFLPQERKEMTVQDILLIFLELLFNV